MWNTIPENDNWIKQLLVCFLRCHLHFFANKMHQLICMSFLCQYRIVSFVKQCRSCFNFLTRKQIFRFFLCLIFLWHHGFLFVSSQKKWTKNCFWLSLFKLQDITFDHFRISNCSYFCIVNIYWIVILVIHFPQGGLAQVERSLYRNNCLIKAGLFLDVFVELFRSVDWSEVWIRPHIYTRSIIIISLLNDFKPFYIWLQSAADSRWSNYPVFFWDDDSNVEENKNAVQLFWFFFAKLNFFMRYNFRKKLRIWRAMENEVKSHRTCV